jgi:RHS repeat-associated protein
MDGRGNVARVVRKDIAGEVLTEARYEYNGLGEMVRAVDAVGNAVEVEYDLLGRRKGLTSPDGGRTEWEYNGKGQLWRETTEVLRAGGKRISYEYDGYGRQVRVKYPESADEEYEYGEPWEGVENLAGRIKKVRDGSGEREYRYGELVEVVWEKRVMEKASGGGEMGAEMEYRGDYLGRMEWIRYPDGERVRYGYNYEGERVSGEKDVGEVWIEKRNAEANGLDIPYRFTGKERDEETGLYYYGARYLGGKASMWLSADPALGDYIPSALVDDQARKRNGKLPGMSGVFNTVNLHLYHYAGNNPVKYTDPDGREKRKPGLLLGMSAHLDIQHALIKEYKGSSPLYLSNFIKSEWWKKGSIFCRLLSEEF